MNIVINICIALFIVLMIYKIVNGIKSIIDRRFDLKLFSLTSYKEVNEELDEFIKDVCIEYFYVNNIMEINYLDDKKQTDMIKEISELVMRRLSGLTLYKLSLFFDTISEVIAMKIYVFINEYSFNTNKPK